MAHVEGKKNKKKRPYIMSPFLPCLLAATAIHDTNERYNKKTVAIEMSFFEPNLYLNFAMDYATCYDLIPELRDLHYSCLL